MGKIFTQKLTVSITAFDKDVIKTEAKGLGISMSELIRQKIANSIGINQKLDDITLQLKAITKKLGNISLIPCGPGEIFDLEKLKKPSMIKPKTKEEVNFADCITDLKSVFANGMNILENMEKAGLKITADAKIKSKEELKEKASKSEKKIYERLEKKLEEQKSILTMKKVVIS